ncbi:amidase family protein [Streptococcus pyogenes]|uniref:amidase family protein n=1 Tax=Streptococcus pyogenes TaxID=1314 RepID=UPI0010A1BA8E|nr:amidase family protein [Streptococcus pyogenes]QCK66535.1 amidase [Streptococcus pyogenes]VGW41305.1 amidase family protein [Streptococcus pyogenes]VGX53810.1 amidase family protein [Streptococcus pyogenes]VGX71860.1 amidase family protein [Streptococcus pyogenes]VGX95500.1 amidase family protein [Streptococcus pyogenes]
MKYSRRYPSQTRQMLLALLLMTASLQAGAMTTYADEVNTNHQPPTAQVEASKPTAMESVTSPADQTHPISTQEASSPLHPLTTEATPAAQESPITLEDYKAASASQLAEWARQQRLTGQQLLDFALETIKETNPELNNVISLREPLARQESEQMTDEGQPFYKVPILVKGLGHTVAGSSNTNGLAFLKDKTSSSTSAFVKQLQKAGFIVVGQSSFPEMGWINVTNSNLYGNTHNPWQLDQNPGGSSGGSAAAVASGQVSLASASDGGGSTRIPASWSGLIGLHPTRGILEGNPTSERSNVSHFALTKSMEDTEKLFQFLLKDKAKAQQNPQRLDTSIPIAYSTQTPAGTPISEEAIAASAAPSINFMAQQTLKRPLQKEDVELLSWALYQTGKDLTKEDVNKAWEGIAAMTEQLNQFYQKYPIFLTPTTAYPAPAADYHHIPKDLVAQLSDMSGLSKEEKLDLIYRQWLPAWTLTPFTQLANLTGTPSLSLPTHVTKSGLPLGILVNSGAHNDSLLLQLGQLFEKANRFHILTAGKKGLLETPTHEHNLSTQSENKQDVAIPVTYQTKGFTTVPTKGQNGLVTLPQTGDGQSKGVLLTSYISLFLGTLFLAGSFWSNKVKD